MARPRTTVLIRHLHLRTAIAITLGLPSAASIPLPHHRSTATIRAPITARTTAARRLPLTDRHRRLPMDHHRPQTTPANTMHIIAPLHHRPHLADLPTFPNPLPTRSFQPWTLRCPRLRVRLCTLASSVLFCLILLLAARTTGLTQASRRTTSPLAQSLDLPWTACTSSPPTL